MEAYIATNSKRQRVKSKFKVYTKKQEAILHNIHSYILAVYGLVHSQYRCKQKHYFVYNM